MEIVEPSYFIDTNILIYATLENDPRFEKARGILFGEAAKTAARFTSVQNLSEMYPNLTGSKMEKPDSPAVAGKKIESIASLPGLIVLPLTPDVVFIALEFCEIHGKLRQDYFDMQIAAFMKRYRITLLFTENEKDFAGIEGIIVVNPFVL